MHNLTLLSATFPPGPTFQHLHTGHAGRSVDLFTLAEASHCARHRANLRRHSCDRTRRLRHVSAGLSGQGNGRSAYRLRQTICKTARGDSILPALIFNDPVTQLKAGRLSLPLPNPLVVPLASLRQAIISSSLSDAP